MYIRLNNNFTEFNITKADINNFDISNMKKEPEVYVKNTSLHATYTSIENIEMLYKLYQTLPKGYYLMYDLKYSILTFKNKYVV